MSCAPQLTWFAAPLVQMAYRCRPLTAFACTQKASTCFPASACTGSPLSVLPSLLQFNQELNAEVLQLEQRYNRLKQPVYLRRNLELRKIQDFWMQVSVHPQQLLRTLCRAVCRVLSSS